MFGGEKVRIDLRCGGVESGVSERNSEKDFELEGGMRCDRCCGQGCLIDW